MTRRSFALATFLLGGLAGVLLLATSHAQTEAVPSAVRIWNTVPRFAIPTRCVNAAGTAFEACGGAGGGGGGGGDLTTTTPLAGANGQVVRNIPSGTQAVSGTVGVSGTVAVSGTVTATPSGTQTVSGTVTANAGTGTFLVGDGTGVLTVDGTLTCDVGSGTQAVSGTVAATQSGVWNVADGGGSLTVDGTVAVSGYSANGVILDGAGAGQADVIAIAPTTEAGLVVRNIPSGTQAVSGTVTSNAGTGTFAVGDGSGALTVDGTVTVTDGAGAMSIDDNGSTISIDDGAGSITVDGTVAISGTPTIQGTVSVSGYSANGIVLDGGGAGQADVVNATPTTEYGIVTRNIPSGTQTVQGTVSVTDGAGPMSIDDNGGSITVDGTVAVSGTTTVQGTVSVSGDGALGYIVDGVAAGRADVVNAAPTTEYGLVTRNIPSGTQTIQGTVSVTDGSGPMTVDGSLSCDTEAATAITTPGASDVGFVVRNIPSGTQTVQGTVSVTGAGGSGYIVDGIATDNADVENGYPLRTNEGLVVRPKKEEPLTYFVTISVSATAANEDMLTLFNATGSGAVLRVRRIMINSHPTAAIVGLVQTYVISRCTTVGTVCTAVIPGLWDTTNSALPGTITAQTKCTNECAGTVTTLLGAALNQDETASGSTWNFDEPDTAQSIVLREAQGLLIKTGALAALGNATITIVFTADVT